MSPEEIVRGEPGVGSRLTLSLAQKQRKPHLMVDIDECIAKQEWPEPLRKFLLQWKPKILNVAGSRESHARGMQETVRRILVDAFQAMS